MTTNTDRPGEAEFLAAYKHGDYPSAAVTADVCMFTIRNGLLQVLLVERADHPYKGHRALPGGFVNSQNSRTAGGESPYDAALREFQEEAGSDFRGHLEQLATFGEPGRDPRGRVYTVAHLAFAPNLPDPVAGSDAADARFWPVEDLPLDGGVGEDGLPLAFDHAKILTLALDRVRSKLEYTTLATRFLSEAFTLSDLERAYAAVWGTEPDRRNFRRKVAQTEGFVVPLGAKGNPGPDGGRPALLYRAGPAAFLNPPMMRPAPGEQVNEDREL